MKQYAGLVILWCASAGLFTAILPWYASRVIERARRNDTPGHPPIELARAFGVVIGLIGAGGWIVFNETLDRDSGMAEALACLGTFASFWWCYRVVVRQSRRALRELRGPEWDNRFNAGFAVLLQGAIFSVPIAAAGLSLLLYWVVGLFGATPGRIMGALCIYPGLVIAALHHRRFARRFLGAPAPLPREVADRVESALGPSSSRRMAALSTEGAPFYNALTVSGVPGASIWISSSCLQSMSADEAAAVLVHEFSHLEKRDDRRRMLTTIAIHSSLLAASAIWLSPGLALSCLFFVIALLVAIGPLGQRQERRADAKAASVGLGAAMGRALVILYRLNAIPRKMDSEKLGTHPLLEKRLAALGIDAPEATRAEAPIIRPGLLRRLLVWCGIMTLWFVVVALTAGALAFLRNSH